MRAVVLQGHLLASRLASVLLVVVCACGDNRRGLALEDFDAERGAAQCARFVRCGLFPDAAACDGYFRERPDIDLHAAVEAGVVLYHGPSAEACIAELANLSCDDSSADVRVRSPACELAFAGTLRANETCALDEECRSGACDVPACPDRCCAGTCRPERRFAAIDEACSRDADCQDDAACGDDLACHPLGGEGAICHSDRQCEFGRGCIGPTEIMPGNCRALPKLGESCPYQRCAEVGAECKTGTCVAPGLPGAACNSDVDCSQFAECEPTSHVCVPTPRLGERCRIQCAGESWCDFSITGICQPPKPNTDPCRSDDQCLSLDCIEAPIFDICAARVPCI
ncbi:MAG: hypothetical protein ABI867_32750 [Kofleriaceae bacterium]